MIGLLKGTVEDVNINQIIVMVHGVGYRIYITPKLLSSLHINQDISLYAHTHVRDDALDLYGFLTKDELIFFELLLNVSGIGPRTALLVIDRGVTSAKNAVMKSDVDFFMAIPRLGKKNAQKIIIELKTKLGSLTELDLSDNNISETKDVMQALISMGFKKPEILKSLEYIDENDTTIELKIKKALKHLSKHYNN